MGLAQALDAARGRIAVGARIARRLAQLVDDIVGRRHVGIAHAEIDDVLAARARLRLEAVDFLEDVRRQPLDAVEIGIHDGNPESAQKSGIWAPCAIIFRLICGAFKARVSCAIARPVRPLAWLAAFALEMVRWTISSLGDRSSPLHENLGAAVAVFALGHGFVIDRLAVAHRLDLHLGRPERPAWIRSCATALARAWDFCEDHFQMPFHRHVGGAAGGMADHPDGARPPPALKAATACAHLGAGAALQSLVPSPGK